VSKRNYTRVCFNPRDNGEPFRTYGLSSRYQWAYRFNPRDNGEPFRTLYGDEYGNGKLSVSIPEIMGSPFGPAKLASANKIVKHVSIPEIMGSPFGQKAAKAKSRNKLSFNPRDNGEPFRTNSPARNTIRQ